MQVIEPPGAWVGRAESAGIRLAIDSRGVARLVGPGYQRAVPYDAAFLDALAAARGPAGLIEDLLLGEEPERLAARVAILLDPISPGPGSILHWASASLAATIAIARAGMQDIAAYESNPLWEPIARERLGQAGLGGRVRVLGCTDDPGIFDLVLLIGDRAHRQPALPPEEGERLARSVRPGGHVLIVGWNVGEPLAPPLSGWSVLRGTRARAAVIRWRCPRGRAPVPNRWRRWSARPGSLFARCWPDASLRFLGERDILVHRPADGARC